MLHLNDIVKYPPAKSVAHTFNSPTSYSQAVEALMSIKETPIYIDSSCDPALRSMSLIFAMSQAKAIIINDLEAAIRSLPFTLKLLVRKKASKLMLLDIYLLDANDRDSFLRNLGKETTNFTLTKDELTAIKSTLRRYLREKLEYDLLDISQQ